MYKQFVDLMHPFLKGSEKYFWINTQPLLKQVHQQERTNFQFVAYRSQFIKTCQFLQPHEDHFIQSFFEEIRSKLPKHGHVRLRGI